MSTKLVISGFISLCLIAAFVTFTFLRIYTQESGGKPFTLSSTQVHVIASNGTHSTQTTKIATKPTSKSPKLPKLPSNISCDYFLNNTAIPPVVAHWHVPFLGARSSPDLPRVLSFQEHDRLLRIMYSLASLLDKNNIELVLFYGSLLGSVRMHDITPWDDDADMLVENGKKKQFLEVLKSKDAKELGVEHLQYQGYVKVWQKGSPKAGKYAWGFPFIDLYFYDKTATHVKVLWSKGYLISNNDFYPLRRRPLGTMWFLAPRNARKTMLDYYGKTYSTLCKSHSWNHRKETGQYSKHKGCKEMLTYYPRVEVHKCDKGEIESVYLGDVPSYSVLIPWTEKRRPFR